MAGVQALTPFHRISTGLVVLLGALPWLNPHAVGPLPNMWPLWLSALCAVGLVIWRRALTGPAVSAGWIGAASISAVLGLLQYLGEADHLAPLVSSSAVGEAFANLRQRNQFATLMATGLLALSAAPPRAGGTGTGVGGWRLAGIALVAIGNAASSSRTGLLQWSLILLLTACWSAPGRRQRVSLASAAMVVYLAAVGLLPVVLRTWTGVESDGLLGRLTSPVGCHSRATLWSNVYELILARPWTGWGWNELSYAHFIHAYDGPRFCEILDNAHNLPLHLAVELGLPVALAVTAAVVALIWRARPWRETDPWRQMCWGVLAVICLHSLLEYPLWYGPFQLSAGLALYLLWRTRPSAGRNGDGDGQAVNGWWPPSGTRWLYGVLAAAACVLLGLVAFSYHQVSQLYLAPDQRSAGYRENTLAKVKDTLFFRRQLAFAELSMTPLDARNADHIQALAMDLLHFSPEPRVVEKLVDSSRLLGDEERARFFRERYRNTYPEDYARWAEAHPPDVE